MEQPVGSLTWPQTHANNNQHAPAPRSLVGGCGRPSPTGPDGGLRDAPNRNVRARTTSLACIDVCRPPIDAPACLDEASRAPRRRSLGKESSTYIRASFGMRVCGARDLLLDRKTARFALGLPVVVADRSNRASSSRVSPRAVVFGTSCVRHSSCGVELHTTLQVSQRRQASRPCLETAIDHSSTKDRLLSAFTMECALGILHYLLSVPQGSSRHRVVSSQRKIRPALASAARLRGVVVVVGITV